MEMENIESIIEKRVISILESTDLDTMTVKKVCEMVGVELAMDISSHKKFIRNLVDSFITSQDNQLVAAKQYDDQGNLIICSLSDKRRVAIQDFQGKKLVSIREYYEKDGKQLPSNKGISLTEEQWEVLRKSIPAIEESIKKFESRRG